MDEYQYRYYCLALLQLQQQHILPLLVSSSSTTTTTTTASDTDCTRGQCCPVVYPQTTLRFSVLSTTTATAIIRMETTEDAINTKTGPKKIITTTDTPQVPGPVSVSVPTRRFSSSMLQTPLLRSSSSSVTYSHLYQYDMFVFHLGKSGGAFGSPPPQQQQRNVVVHTDNVAHENENELEELVMMVSATDPPTVLPTNTANRNKDNRNIIMNGTTTNMMTNTTMTNGCTNTSMVRNDRVGVECNNNEEEEEFRGGKESHDLETVAAAANTSAIGRTNTLMEHKYALQKVANNEKETYIPRDRNDDIYNTIKHNVAMMMIIEEPSLTRTTTNVQWQIRLPNQQPPILSKKADYNGSAIFPSAAISSGSSIPSNNIIQNDMMLLTFHHNIRTQQQQQQQNHPIRHPTSVTMVDSCTDMIIRNSPATGNKNDVSSSDTPGPITGSTTTTNTKEMDAFVFDNDSSSDWVLIVVNDITNDNDPEIEYEVTATGAPTDTPPITTIRNDGSDESDKVVPVSPEIFSVTSSCTTNVHSSTTIDAATITEISTDSKRHLNGGSSITTITSAFTKTALVAAASTQVSISLKHSNSVGNNSDPEQQPGTVVNAEEFDDRLLTALEQYQKIRDGTVAVSHTLKANAPKLIQIKSANAAYSTTTNRIFPLINILSGDIANNESKIIQLDMIYTFITAPRKSLSGTGSADAITKSLLHIGNNKVDMRPKVNNIPITTVIDAINTTGSRNVVHDVDISASTTVTNTSGSTNTQISGNDSAIIQIPDKEFIDANSSCRNVVDDVDIVVSTATNTTGRTNIQIAGNDNAIIQRIDNKDEEEQCSTNESNDFVVHKIMTMIDETAPTDILKVRLPNQTYSNIVSSKTNNFSASFPAAATLGTSNSSPSGICINSNMIQNDMLLFLFNIQPQNCPENVLVGDDCTIIMDDGGGRVRDINDSVEGPILKRDVSLHCTDAAAAPSDEVTLQDLALVNGNNPALVFEDIMNRVIFNTCSNGIETEAIPIPSTSVLERDVSLQCTDAANAPIDEHTSQDLTSVAGNNRVLVFGDTGDHVVTNNVSNDFYTELIQFPSSVDNDHDVELEHDIVLQCTSGRTDAAAAPNDELTSQDVALVNDIMNRVIFNRCSNGIETETIPISSTSALERYVFLQCTDAASAPSDEHTSQDLASVAGVTNNVSNDFYTEFIQFPSSVDNDHDVELERDISLQCTNGSTDAAAAPNDELTSQDVAFVGDIMDRATFNSCSNGIETETIPISSTSALERYVSLQCTDAANAPSDEHTSQDLASVAGNNLALVFDDIGDHVVTNNISNDFYTEVIPFPSPVDNDHDVELEHDIVLQCTDAAAASSDEQTSQDLALAVGNNHGEESKTVMLTMTPESFRGTIELFEDNDAIFLGNVTEFVDTQVFCDDGLQKITMDRTMEGSMPNYEQKLSGVTAETASTKKNYLEPKEDERYIKQKSPSVVPTVPAKLKPAVVPLAISYADIAKKSKSVSTIFRAVSNQKSAVVSMVDNKSVSNDNANSVATQASKNVGDSASYLLDSTTGSRFVPSLGGVVEATSNKKQKANHFIESRPTKTPREVVSSSVNPYVLVLTSPKDTQNIRMRQIETLSYMESNGIEYKELDCMDTRHQNECTSLYMLSRLSNVYPQYFHVDESGIPAFCGTIDLVENMIKDGSYLKKFGGRSICINGTNDDDNSTDGATNKYRSSDVVSTIRKAVERIDTVVPMSTFGNGSADHIEPILSTTGVPALAKGINKVKNPSESTKRKTAKHDGVKSGVSASTIILEAIIENQEKTEITMYGATSFVARHALDYFMQVSLSLRGDRTITLAGRNETKLRTLQATLTEKMSNLTMTTKKPMGKCQFDIFVADVADVTALFDMVQRTQLVANFAGPYTKYGENVVAACARSGTDYIDITGEISWAGQMRQRYSESAEKSGARIISLCGFDSIPSDIAIFGAVDALRKARRSNVEIEAGTCWHSNMGMANGGTIHSALGIPINLRYCFSQPVPFLLDDPLVLTHPRTRFDPNNQETKNRMAKVEWLNQLPSFDSILVLGASASFFMAPINSKVVHATALALNYGPYFTYRERFLPLGMTPTRRMGFLSILSAVMVQLGLLFVAAILMTPCVGKFLADWLAPPGSGAPDYACRAGFAHVYAEVSTKPGSGKHIDKANCSIQFVGDPGNWVTAQCVCESALALILDKGKLPPRSKDGFGTPAELLGNVLLSRLQSTSVRPVKIKMHVRKDVPQRETVVFL